MNGYLHAVAKGLRLSDRYGGEVECKKKKVKYSWWSNVSEYKRGKNCAIFICPYRETAVARIPAIDFESKRKQMKTDFRSSKNNSGS